MERNELNQTGIVKEEDKQVLEQAKQSIVNLHAQSGGEENLYTDKMNKKINEEDYREQLSDLSAKITWDWRNLKNCKIKDPFNIKRI